MSRRAKTREVQTPDEIATRRREQATNTPMDLSHQIVLLMVLLLTSKGAAGVTGSGFIVLAATLSAIGTLPVTALVLILGIDRFMSEARALTNLVGNGVAALGCDLAPMPIPHIAEQQRHLVGREYFRDAQLLPLIAAFE